MSTDAAALQRAMRATTEGRSVEAAVEAAATSALATTTLLDLEGELLAHLRGAGPDLQPHLDDPAVTDLLVNGPAGVWVDRGQGLQRIPAPSLGDETAVRALATRLAAACGRRLDEASPIVDGTLPDGSRLHAVLPPVASEGTMISLRTLRRRAMSLTDLMAAGAFPQALEPAVTRLVTARANVMISGSTGSGKTTMLAALLGQAAPTERIVCIEDSVELRPAHPHVIHLVVRRPNVQRVGEVGMSELVRAAMRMRPDRIVLGECRGAEVRDVLGALNTGHEGGWATVHANTAADVPARLVALGALANLSATTVAAQACAALDAVIHLRRTTRGRRLTEIGVLEAHGDTFRCIDALRVATDGTVIPGPGWDALRDRLGAEAMPTSPDLPRTRSRRNRSTPPQPMRPPV